MNAPEWPYIVLGSISAIVEGVVNPAFALVFSCILGVCVIYWCPYENVVLILFTMYQCLFCFLLVYKSTSFRMTASVQVFSIFHTPSFISIGTLTFAAHSISSFCHSLTVFHNKELPLAKQFPIAVCVLLLYLVTLEIMNHVCVTCFNSSNKEKQDKAAPTDKFMQNVP